MQLFYMFAAIASLGVVIFVHELGHFLMCRWRGIRVEKFSIGFGPPLIKWTAGGTIYQLALLPLGGYVKPAGEWEEAADGDKQHPKDEFLGQAWWSRGLVLVAGPLVNLIFPVLVLFALYMTTGRSYPYGPPVVQNVMAASGAAAGGIQVGDQILRIDEQEVPGVARLAKMVDKLSRVHPDQPLKVKVLRDAKLVDLKVSARLNSERGQYLMGVQITEGKPPYSQVVERAMVLTPAEKAGFMPGDEVLEVGGKPLKNGFAFSEQFAKADQDPVVIVVLRKGARLSLSAPKKQPVPEGLASPELLGLVGLEFKVRADAAERGGGAAREKLGARDAILYSLLDNAGMAVGMAASLAQVFTGRISARESLGGPVAIVRMAHQQAEKGWQDWVQLVCSLSLILGIMNLLPIPLLDGGTLVFCVIEGIMRRPLSPKIQRGAQSVGIALLGALFIFTTFNDILRLFGK